MNKPPLPEPHMTDDAFEIPLSVYTADQMLAFQQDTVEACAKVCEEYETANDITATWQNIIADKIRSMKHE